MDYEALRAAWTGAGTSRLSSIALHATETLDTPPLDLSRVIYVEPFSGHVLDRLVGEASYGTRALPRDRIQSLEIPILSLAEQWPMAHIIGTLDDKAYA